MKKEKPTAGENLLTEPPEFSLVLGGPLFQLLRSARLTDDALELLYKRIIVITLLVWLPLLLLSALEGNLLGGSLAVPFLLDIEVQVRFLVVLPLLIAAELVVHRRMRLTVKTFLERRLIPADALPRFNAAISSAFRLRNSVSAEILLIVVVYVAGILILWRQHMVLDVATWYALPSAGGSKLSFAGMWYGYVSLAFFQFLLARWYFRLLIWMRFLWQVSRIELCLVPTHPDRSGGLGFLARTVDAFAPVAAAHGAIIAGFIANRIFHLGATLPEFTMEVASCVVFLLFLLIVPLLVFTPQIALAKRTGRREYGTLAQHYVRDFDTKWLRGSAPAAEPFLGNSDIQSLADLGNSYAMVLAMRIVPVTKHTILYLAAVTLAPIAPLALTMMPLEVLLKKLFGILF